MIMVMVGCGHMGYALLDGWVKNQKIIVTEIHVIEPNEDLRHRAQLLGVHAYENNKLLPLSLKADILFFAIPPFIMKDVVPHYKNFCHDKTTILTIAAGIKMQFFINQFGIDTPIIRTMPNIAASIGEGVIAIQKNDYVPDEIWQKINDLLRVNGKIIELKDEQLFDAVTAISGSGPGYIFHFMECMIEGAQKLGLSKENAILMVQQTLLGSVKLSLASQKDACELRKSVTTPNGTTEAALKQLMKDQNLENLIMKTVSAAYQRSNELSQ